MHGLTGVCRRREGVMLRARPDNEEALEALQAHARLVIQSAARVLGNISEAEDVAQDLAERLLRSPPREVRHWPALLKTMAVNASIDRLRRRREEHVEHEPVTDQGPPEAFAQADQARVLRKALAQLSARDAALYSFYYLADLKQADIARQLSMTPSAVGVALHRVRQRLTGLVRAQLNPEALKPESLKTESHGATS